MVGFVRQSLLFPQPTAKSFQKLGKRIEKSRSKKIEDTFTAMVRFVWQPLNFCHALPSLLKILARKIDMLRRRQKFKLTFTAMFGFLRQSIIFPSHTAKSFQNLSKKNRNVKRKIKNQTYIHCYGWVLLTLTSISSTHCQGFSKFWQEK